MSSSSASSTKHMHKVSRTPCRTPEERPGAAGGKSHMLSRLQRTETERIVGKGGKLEAPTAVDGQIDVAVLCSQQVGGGAAIQTRRLG